MRPAIPHNATAADVAAALRGLASIGDVRVTVENVDGPYDDGAPLIAFSSSSSVACATEATSSSTRAIA